MPPTPSPNPPPPVVAASPVNVASLQQLLLYIATSIVRARGAQNLREVRLRKWYIGVSIAFSLLGTAGVVKTKVEELPANVLSWGFVLALVTLVLLFGLELYRAWGVEETALKALAASRAFSLLDLRTRHALRKGNTLDEVQKCVKQSEDLEEMFDDILPNPAPGSPEYHTIATDAQTLVTSWLAAQQAAGGVQIPVSQQKPKNP